MLSNSRLKVKLGVITSVLWLLKRGDPTGYEDATRDFAKSYRFPEQANRLNTRRVEIKSQLGFSPVTAKIRQERPSKLVVNVVTGRVHLEE